MGSDDNGVSVLADGLQYTCHLLGDAANGIRVMGVLGYPLNLLLSFYFSLKNRGWRDGSGVYIT